jgi:glycosyltransferase involved in cell wall biosynthesis
MIKEPLVSILMTAYNREKYIGFAIESVLASSYKNWELIIVDDGSTDETVSVASAIAQMDSRIRIYKNAVNIGDYPNRNKAAGYATGKYLKYIDADDAIYPWGLEAEVGMMEKFPESGYGLDSIAQDDKVMYPYQLAPAEAYEAFYLHGVGLFDKSPTSSIINRSVFNKVGGFKDIRMVGDCEMWHRLSLEYPLVVMPHGIIWSREHQESESGSQKNLAHIRYRYLIVKRDFLLNDACPMKSSDRHMLTRKLALDQLKILFKLATRLKFQVANEVIRMDTKSLGKLIGYQIAK